jgi:hypothetical protein
MPPGYGKFVVMFGSLRCESWKKLLSLVFWGRLPYLSTSHPSETECMLNGRNGAHELYMIFMPSLGSAGLRTGGPAIQSRMMLPPCAVRSTVCPPSCFHFVGFSKCVVGATTTAYSGSAVTRN